MNESHKEDCIFCAIARGEAPHFPVYSDTQVLAFLDLFPVTPGHTLLITRNHYANLLEANPQEVAAVARASVSLAAAVKRVAGCAGLGVYQLNGEAAGQTVFHYHVHLVPREGGSQLQLHARQRGDDEELARIAGEIRAAMQSGAG